MVVVTSGGSSTQPSVGSLVYGHGSIQKGWPGKMGTTTSTIIAKNGLYTYAKHL